jgi:hypothetical protein
MPKKSLPLKTKKHGAEYVLQFLNSSQGGIRPAGILYPLIGAPMYPQAFCHLFLG